jgi:hypothetical protein
MISSRRNVSGLSVVGLAERAISIAVITVIAAFRRKPLQSLRNDYISSRSPKAPPN